MAVEKTRVRTFPPALMLLTVLLLQQPFIAAATQESRPEAKDKSSSGLMNTARRDAANGVGGWFSIDADSRRLRTDWGYADIETLNGGNRKRITLLSSPVSSENYPNLRLVIQLKLQPLEEYLGRELRLQRVRLRLDPESNRLRASRGAGTVVLEKLEDGWLEGRFEFEVDGQQVSGSFRARFHRAPPHPARTICTAVGGGCVPAIALSS